MRATRSLLLNPPDIRRSLASLIRQIPAGRVASCGQLAEALGDRAAARFVGRFLLDHDHGPGCACHRVLRADGTLGSFIAGGPEEKRRLLAGEGIEWSGERVDVGRFGFSGFRSSRPLERLSALQDEAARRIRLYRRRRVPRLVGGIDLAYPREDQGVGAIVVVDTDNRRVVWSTVLRRQVRFPYITGYLAFRELPLLVRLVEAAARTQWLPEVLLVDGSGVLHPRRMGVATHLGVALDLPTVGVTKTLLCGRVDWRGMGPGESRSVCWQGGVSGVAIRPTAGSRRPIFVSPGHRVDVAFAERLVRQMLSGRRLPDPIYWADRLSRQAAIGAH